jgi:hypothetical protein
LLFHTSDSLRRRPSKPPVTNTSCGNLLKWLTNGGPITEAAQFAGVARQTVSRWLKEDDDFRAIYDGWRDQIMTMTDGQLSALAESATTATCVRRNL